MVAARRHSGDRPAAGALELVGAQALNASNMVEPYAMSKARTGVTHAPAAAIAARAAGLDACGLLCAHFLHGEPPCRSRSRAGGCAPSAPARTARVHRHRARSHDEPTGARQFSRIHRGASKTRPKPSMEPRRTPACAAGYEYRTVASRTPARQEAIAGLLVSRRNAAPNKRRSTL